MEGDKGGIIYMWLRKRVTEEAIFKLRFDGWRRSWVKVEGWVERIFDGRKGE